MPADPALTRPHPEMPRGYAAVLWTLSLLFVLRVAGQALQRWAPQPFLPPFDSFQGSSLPYGLLLAAQLAIIAFMASVSWRVAMGTLRASRRVGRVLTWIGGFY